MFKLLYVLHRMKMLSPIGMGRLIRAILKNGINMMTLLEIAARTYRDKVAVVDDEENVSYQQLFKQSEQLASALFQKYELKSGQKVGVLCRNHVALVRSIFAVSRLGADLYLLNTEMGKEQLQKIGDEKLFDLLIYDPEVNVAGYRGVKLLSNESFSASTKLPRTSMGKLMLLTGGTTGKPKEAAHKPSLLTYLNPFLGLLSSLKLLNYRTAYIATPIYHGYGLAVLFLFLTLGKKVIISKRFAAEQACALIRMHQVEVVTAVPLMVQRMLNHKTDDLQSLRCIASGSAPLNPTLSQAVSEKLGDVLYNLYGTSEAGLIIIATPQDLKHCPKTIGRKIEGVQLKVLDENKREVEPGDVGVLSVKTKSDWIETGDLGYQDQQGYYFLCGRSDDMIVSGGVNVYPIELEQVLLQHPLIEDAAVIGIPDDQFGQRLKAYVRTRAHFSNEELLEWLRPRVARFQMPRDIVFMGELPYTPLGKVDKKRLRGAL